MKSFPIIIGILLCCLVTSVYGMSYKDITDNLCQSDENTTVIDMICQFAEPYCNYWVRDWKFQLSRDSIKTMLYNALVKIYSGYFNEFSYESMILKGLIWHYLYQLEVDTAFTKVDSITDWLMATFPEESDAAWLRGINLVKGTQIKRGFRILDSLRVGGHVHKESFLLDYAKLASMCFLPAHDVFSNDSVIVLSDFQNVIPTIHLRDEELFPKCQTWSAISFKNHEENLPGFVFSAQFDLVEQIKLRFPTLTKTKKSILDLKINDKIVKNIPGPLFYNPDTPPRKMQVKVVIDCRPDKPPLSQYLCDIVCNNYDVVKEKKDLLNLNAMSLRCYNRSLFKDTPDDFYAYIVFDYRFCGNLHFFYQPEGIDLPKESLDIRYLIAMKTSQAVEEKAELILHDILSKFKHYVK